MTLWLPEDEAAQLRFEFETEMAAGDGLSCFLFGSITKVGMLLPLTRLDIVEPPSPARPARGEGIRLRFGASQFGA